jgi:hypothetical protein
LHVTHRHQIKSIQYPPQFANRINSDGKPQIIDVRADEYSKVIAYKKTSIGWAIILK